jgi:hypothetical protein
MWGSKPIAYLPRFVPSLWITALVYLSLLGALPSAFAHPFQGLIYGKVTMKDNQTQEGILLWANRQLFWEDIFEALHEKDTALDFLRPDEIKQLSDQEIKDKIEWGFMHLWEKNMPSRSQKFSCRFGDLGSLTVMEDNNAVLYFKNGSSIRIRGNERHKDVGDRIDIIDPTGEWHRVKWENISRIEFMPTPASALTSPVKPIFGTVKTDSGELTGFIKWDQDETMTSFRLDGKKDGKKKRISFGAIQKIEKIAANACEITLVSDQKIILTDNDDVGPTNHGLTVFVKGVGGMAIRWKNFKEVTFDHDQTSTELMGYLDFGPPKVLWGRVKTTAGEFYKGKLIYDLDEQWDFETLEGKEDNLHYSIALRDISLIEPHSANYATIVLKNGRKLNLNGHHDVSDKNWGVLVWKGSNAPKYIPWKSIQSITLP